MVYLRWIGMKRSSARRISSDKPSSRISLSVNSSESKTTIATSSSSELSSSWVATIGFTPSATLLLREAHPERMRSEENSRNHLFINYHSSFCLRPCTSSTLPRVSFSTPDRAPFRRLRAAAGQRYRHPPEEASYRRGRRMWIAPRRCPEILNGSLNFGLSPLGLRDPCPPLFLRPALRWRRSLRSRYRLFRSFGCCSQKYWNCRILSGWEPWPQLFLLLSASYRRSLPGRRAKPLPARQFLQPGSWLPRSPSRSYEKYVHQRERSRRHRPSQAFQDREDLRERWHLPSLRGPCSS